MKEKDSSAFFGSLYDRGKKQIPLCGQIELTYRCNLNCLHCYAKGLERPREELTSDRLKDLIDQVTHEGCMHLCLTGGEPLIRDDFFTVYSYAKKKGLLITIFTNGLLLTEKTIGIFKRQPPFAIEITLNGITKETYETITQTPGSFETVMSNIRLAAENGLPLIIKTNCLKENKDEIDRIKEWTEDLLGKPSENRHRFKYDPMIYPRLNGDKTPAKSRLSFEGLEELRKQDIDIWDEYQRVLQSELPDLERDGRFLYRCTAWMQQFFINPYGRLKFCQFSEKFSVDLKTTSFHEGFYHVFPRLLSEQFKTDSKCKNCSLRPFCYHCPARAYLETGDEEAPVEYYCELAHSLKHAMRHTKAKATL